MYHLTVRDHMMIAHSFNSPTFGPAQKLHGATYIVDVTFYRTELDADDLVVDIGAAAQVLGQITEHYSLTNLDTHEALAGHNTTTEFMARVVFDDMQRAIEAGKLGAGAKGLSRLGVRLAESHIAWAGYEADL